MNVRITIHRAVLWSVLLGQGLLGAELAAQDGCFDVVPVDASNECSGEFICACSGGGIDFARVTVNGIGSISVSGTRGNSPAGSCCRSQVATPQHHELVLGTNEVVLLEMIPGRLFTGKCRLDCGKFLFIASWGTAICSYSDGVDFGLYPLYQSVGPCLDPDA